MLTDPEKEEVKTEDGEDKESTEGLPEPEEAHVEESKEATDDLPIPLEAHVEEADVGASDSEKHAEL